MKKTNILEKIVERKKKQQQQTWEMFEKNGGCTCENAQKANNNQKEFTIEKNKENQSFYLIAECKKASPSKGRMSKESYRPTILAKSYEKAGASAISVLCEENFFQGHLEHLKEIKKITSLPVLQKDFIIHEKQIWDGYHAGADLCLFIVRILTFERLSKLIDYARALGMGYLIEIYGNEDMEKIHQLIAEKNLINDKSCLIGINNRDLSTFAVDFERSFHLKNQLSNQLKIISESGIEKSEDVEKIAANGFFGALVGEILMRSNDKEKIIKNMLHTLPKKR